MIPSITPKALKVELDGLNPPVILDVREAHELEISQLPYPFVHIPMGELAFRLGELDPGQNFVVLCRVGGRSGHVTRFLLGNGFAQVRNIDGGVNRWAVEIDPTMSSY
jgi:adenylyltransferase/sulfurtransferase